MLPGFRHIWAGDFEFQELPGQHPKVHCFCTLDLVTGQEVRLWRDELPAKPPIDIGPDSLFIGHYVVAELKCFLELGWELPAHVLDTFAEAKVLFNGQRDSLGQSLQASLLAVLRHFGISSIDPDEKGRWRHLAIDDGPWTPANIQGELAYCWGDVACYSQLLPRMWQEMLKAQGGNEYRALRLALLRGRYAKAQAQMERRGVPIDLATLNSWKSRWPLITRSLIQRYDRAAVFDGTSFREARWFAYMRRSGIDWPRLAQNPGRLDLKAETFSSMAKRYSPAVGPYHQLRKLLSETREIKLIVGPDGRNRTSLKPYRSITGRKQPSSTKFVFGNPKFMRGLIKPEAEMGLAYLDYRTQEVGIAAGLSGDPMLKDAYCSGDIYVGFGRQTGLIPPYGNAKSHSRERSVCKAIVLGISYGMQAPGLALSLGVTEFEAAMLLKQHRKTYPIFWDWAGKVQNTMMLGGMLCAPMGWQYHRPSSLNLRQIQNWPMQAAGSEIMRVAAVLLTEAGIELCCPVHDAMLIQAPMSELNETIA